MDTIHETWAQNTAAVSNSESSTFSKYDPPSNDRSLLMTRIPGAKLTDFPEYILQPTPLIANGDVNTEKFIPTMFSMPPMTTHIFYLSPASLLELKAAAEAYSTNDALSAFLWRHMTLARNQSNQSPYSEKTSALLSAVNIRTRTSPPLPRSYLGDASMATLTSRLSVSTLTVTSGLKTAATTVRKTPKIVIDTPNRIPLTIGLLDARPDPTESRSSSLLSMVSWARISLPRAGQMSESMTVFGANWERQRVSEFQAKVLMGLLLFFRG